METFTDRLDLAVERKGISMRKFSLDMKIRNATFYEWKRNGGEPYASDAWKMAEYLNVSPEWLITGKESSLSNEELEILKYWRDLSPDRKDNVYLIIKTMAEASNQDLKKDIG